MNYLQTDYHAIEITLTNLNSNSRDFMVRHQLNTTRNGSNNYLTDENVINELSTSKLNLANNKIYLSIILQYFKHFNYILITMIKDVL
ncbi:unnamed protein product [Schistosoma turkestanicum]|nr:unnamed protein product [Schistosoma turkestanicum]